MPHVSVYDAFAHVYSDWAADMTEDVPFYVELARETSGPLVELAVGTGRVAIPVTLATGRPVLGIDSSPAMIERGRAAAEEAGAAVEFRLGDMRELELDEPAGLVYCPFRSLLHLPTWSDRRRVFERVVASLRPGGRFAWNSFVFDPKIAVALDGTTQSQHGVVHTLHYHPGSSRIDITYEDTTISLFWIARAEWEGLIDVAGLEVEALHGWFDRRPFADDSREFVWVTRKPM
jgi:SAM-dependent methyltransferase